MSIEGLPTGPRPDEISERSMHDFLAQAEEKLRERGLSPTAVQEFSRIFEAKFREGYPAFMEQEGRKRVDDYIDEILKQTKTAMGNENDLMIQGLLSVRAKRYQERIGIMKEVEGTDTVAPFPSHTDTPEAPVSVEVTAEDFKRLARHIIEQSTLFEISGPHSTRVGEMAEAEKRKAAADRAALIATLEDGGDPYELVEERYGPIPPQEISDTLYYLGHIYDKLGDTVPNLDEIARLLGKLKLCLQSL